MKRSNYDHIIKSESSARKYLLGFCFKNYQRFCPRCRYRKFYRMSDGRRRCHRCRYTFRDFSGRWIDTGNISCVSWLKIVKLFELELSIRKMTSRLGTSYDTVYKAVTAIRSAIAAHAEDSVIRAGRASKADRGDVRRKREADRGTGPSGKPPVFGLRESGGRVFIQAIPNVRAEKVLQLGIRKVQWRNIIYTDKYGSFDSLMFCCLSQVPIDHSAAFSKGPVSINGLEGFWSYAKQRIMGYHGVSSHRFPLYLKELEFRYNHREEDIFPVIVEFLCDLKP
jgi:transposase